MRSLPEWKGRTDDSAVPARVKLRIAGRTEYKCVKCGRECGGKLRAEYDHVVPLCLGGEHKESNLQLLCSDCHKGKTVLDVKLKAKTARIRKRQLGIKKPRTITKWRNFRGELVTASRER